jgi:hypothetical protein
VALSKGAANASMDRWADMWREMNVSLAV